MAPSKSTHKTAPQPAPADPPLSPCTTIQLVKHADHDLTYDEIHYREKQINHRHQEIALAKAEREFKVQPWWDLCSAVVCGAMTLTLVFFLGAIILSSVVFIDSTYNDMNGEGTSQAENK